MLLIMSIILVLAILAIALPLYWRSQARDLTGGEPSSAITELRRQKESSYAAIQELQMDHHMGKLSDGDYQDLYRRYKSEALDAIQAEAHRLSGPDWDAAIEEEINRKRRELPGNASSLTCPACSSVNESDSRFCHACGHNLSPVCPDCHLACEPWNRFCPRCGARLGCSPEKG